MQYERVRCTGGISAPCTSRGLDTHTCSIVSVVAYRRSARCKLVGSTHNRSNFRNSSPGCTSGRPGTRATASRSRGDAGTAVVHRSGSGSSGGQGLRRGVVGEDGETARAGGAAAARRRVGIPGDASRGQMDRRSHIWAGRVRMRNARGHWKRFMKRTLQAWKKTWGGKRQVRPLRPQGRRKVKHVKGHGGRRMSRRVLDKWF